MCTRYMQIIMVIKILIIVRIILHAREVVHGLRKQPRCRSCQFDWFRISSIYSVFFSFSYCINVCVYGVSVLQFIHSQLYKCKGEAFYILQLSTVTRSSVHSVQRGQLSMIVQAYYTRTIGYYVVHISIKLTIYESAHTHMQVVPK